LSSQNQKGASVEVDTQSWEDPTNTRRYVPAGQREIRIAKRGCVPSPLVKEVDIKAATRTTYEGRLDCPAAKLPKR
jgi:hypothetical protein